MINVKIEIDGNIESFDIADKNVERFKQKFMDLADVDYKDWNYDNFCKFIAEDFVSILENEIDDGDYGLFNYQEVRIMRNTFLEYKLKRVNKTNVENVSGVLRKLGFEDLADKMDTDVSDMQKDMSGMLWNDIKDRQFVILRENTDESMDWDIEYMWNSDLVDFYFTDRVNFDYDVMESMDYFNSKDCVMIDYDDDNYFVFKIKEDK